MKKIIFLLCMISISIAMQAQKKKTKAKFSKFVAEIHTLKEDTASSPIYYQKAPVDDIIHFAYPIKKNHSSKKDNEIDTFSIPNNTEACPCKDYEKILLKLEDFTSNNSSSFGLKGKVKNVVESKIRDTTVGYWETLYKKISTEYAFLENGNLKSEEEKRGNFSSKHIQNYNEAYHPISADIFLWEQPIATLHFNYNNIDLKEISSKPKLESTQMHPKIEILFNCFLLDSNKYIQSNRMKNDTLQEQITKIYNAQNQLIESFESNKRELIHKLYKYDKNNNMCQISYLNDDNEIKSSITLTYDQFGNCIKKMYASHSYVIFKYKFDYKNNWIYKQETTYSKVNSELVIDERITSTRTIAYY